MNRRGFLQSILAAGIAPAIVKAENLMGIYIPPKKILIAVADTAGINGRLMFSPSGVDWITSMPSRADIRAGMARESHIDGVFLQQYKKELLHGFKVTEKIIS